MDQMVLSEIARKGGFLAVVITLDLLSGVAIALKEGKFRFEKLPDFMKKYVPMIVGWLLAESASVIPEDIYTLANLPIPYVAFLAIGDIAYGFVFGGGIASFLANLATIGLLKEWLEKYGFKK